MSLAEIKAEVPGVVLTTLDSGVARESGVLRYRCARCEGTFVAKDALLKVELPGNASLICGLPPEERMRSKPLCSAVSSGFPSSLS